MWFLFFKTVKKGPKRKFLKLGRVPFSRKTIVMTQEGPLDYLYIWKNTESRQIDLLSLQIQRQKLLMKQILDNKMLVFSETDHNCLCFDRKTLMLQKVYKNVKHMTVLKSNDLMH
jgi:hypothetical protein